MLVDPTRTDFPERDRQKTCVHCRRPTSLQADVCWECSAKRRRRAEAEADAAGTLPIFDRGSKGLIYRKNTGAFSR